MDAWSDSKHFMVSTDIPTPNAVEAFQSMGEDYHLPNDSLSLTVATFKMNLLELIGRVEENGSIPVLVTIPRRYDTDNTAFITEANAWIKSLGYWYIDEYALLPADRLLNDMVVQNVWVKN